MFRDACAWSIAASAADLVAVLPGPDAGVLGGVLGLLVRGAARWGRRAAWPPCGGESLVDEDEADVVFVDVEVAQEPAVLVFLVGCRIMGQGEGGVGQ